MTTEELEAQARAAEVRDARGMSTRVSREEVAERLKLAHDIKARGGSVDRELAALDGAKPATATTTPRRPRAAAPVAEAPPVDAPARKRRKRSRPAGEDAAARERAQDAARKRRRRAEARAAKQARRRDVKPANAPPLEAPAAAGASTHAGPLDGLATARAALAPFPPAVRLAALALLEAELAPPT